MAKRIFDEESKLDITAMIDVVFLLIIFFILMPAREMDYRLEAHLPEKSIDKNSPTPKQDPTYQIKITTKNIGHDEVVTQVHFNQQPVCEFVTCSLQELDRIYQLPRVQKQARLKEEYRRDELQFHPVHSDEISRLMRRLEHAISGTLYGKKTKLVIDASPKVPFKVVMAILNATTGAGYENVNFRDPGQIIWNQN
jgi:biopolymer transport protein ExbD